MSDLVRSIQNLQRHSAVLGRHIRELRFHGFATLADNETETKRAIDEQIAALESAQRGVRPADKEER
jgi:hypothetical protein